MHAEALHGGGVSRLQSGHRHVISLIYIGSRWVDTKASFDPYLPGQLLEDAHCHDHWVGMYYVVSLWSSIFPLSSLGSISLKRQV